jgi:hypothetical protein
METTSCDENLMKTCSPSLRRSMIEKVIGRKEELGGRKEGSLKVIALIYSPSIP